MWIEPVHNIVVHLVTIENRVEVCAFALTVK